MNNDDMSDDEFDAFLRGEDDLSRRLQGLTQPASSPKLDATILGYVKAGLEQEAQAAQPARPAAANDPVIEGAPPRLAPGLGRRWRIPAGIAAGVLAGVLGHQVYQGSGTRMEERMAAAPAAQASPQAANVIVDMAAPPAQMAPSMAPPVVMAEAPPPVAETRAAAAAPAPAPKEALAELKRPEPDSKPRPEPEPPPVRIAAAPPSQLQRVEITGSSIKRKDAESAVPVQVMSRNSVAAASTPSNQGYDGYNSDNPVPDMPITSAKVAAAVPPPAVASAPPPAPAPAPAPAPPAPMVAAVPANVEKYDRFNSPGTASSPAARSAPPAARMREKDSVETSKMLAPAASPADAKRAKDWLDVIDTMLKAKLEKDALAEWAKFRAAYPDYPVPAATRKRIDAIKQ